MDISPDQVLPARQYIVIGTHGATLADVRFDPADALRQALHRQAAASTSPDADRNLGRHLRRLQAVDQKDQPYHHRDHSRFLSFDVQNLHLSLIHI